jgi:hypothetical protein
MIQFRRFSNGQAQVACPFFALIGVDISRAAQKPTFEFAMLLRVSNFGQRNFDLSD